MLYIGIDPGEAWCGFAALEFTDAGDVRAEARTYSVKARRGHIQMAHDIVDLLPHSKKTEIACEDFRVRRVGHQAFSAAVPLRFIGALEYGVSKVDAFSFYLIPPRDPGRDELKNLFGRPIVAYRKHWPRPSKAAWGHCASAWRVLGQHLLNRDPGLLVWLHKRKSHRCNRWLPVLQKSKLNDYVAPAVQWITPKD